MIRTNQMDDKLVFYPVTRKVRKNDALRRIIQEANQGEYDLVIITIFSLVEPSHTLSVQKELLKKFTLLLVGCKISPG